MKLNECFDFTQHQQLDIAIISDSHGDVADEIINLVKQCDIVIHAGDIGNKATLELLEPKLKHILAIAGNNDKPYMWEVKDWDIVKSLADSIDIKLPGGTLSVEHGHEKGGNKPSHDTLRYSYQFSRAIIYGHTHHQVIDDINPDQWVVNPGACGTTRTHGGASCLKLSVNDTQWHIDAYRFLP